ncbi:hypothetical protein F5051DRAFT_106447 [Lentinula edodes]|nr:hypothetical protein F5051DRAFT_106447 [Lentinula edodes]
MPGRRAPPSPLRLVQGPTPPRSAPKHTMPSVPRPTFCPPMIVSRGATGRPRASALQRAPRHEVQDRSQSRRLR